MPHKGKVVAYDSAWALCVLFSVEMLTVHYIGSTAIPGLKARPIIRAGLWQIGI